MTQYQDPFGQPYMDPTAQPRRTSGLAITALVFSLLGIIPCCGAILAPIGAILGVIGAAVLGPKAAKKGRGMSIAAIALGLAFTGGQAMLYLWGRDFFVQPVVQGPGPALSAATTGNIAEFKSRFHGAGASASDSDAKAFVDELTQRYGAYVGCDIDESSNQQPQFGQPQLTFPYVIRFQNKTVNADTQIIFSDPQGGGFVMKLGYITVFDPDNGDLTYPPAARGSTTAPSGSSNP